jgi:hypothetical protein
LYVGIALAKYAFALHDVHATGELALMRPLTLPRANLHDPVAV